MAILNNNPLIGSGGQQGYSINNSLRFRSSASAYLSRTFGTPTDAKKFTFSCWVKRGSLGTYQELLGAGTSASSTNYAGLYFNDSANTVGYVDNPSGTDVSLQITNAVFRDPSAWYHIVLSVDTTQATAANRVIIYVNGVQQTLATNSPTYTQNASTFINTSGRLASIGAVRYSAAYVNYLDGYLAETYLIDGQALTPSSFGETDTTTGVWKPKAYSSTYGTNGFYLKFSDIATTSGSNAGLGKDFSGNSNYWTTNNISVTSGTTYDAMTDSPTNTSATVANYAVMNPLWKDGTTVIAQGNLDVSNGNYGGFSTLTIPTNSKFYAEFTVTATQGNQGVGILKAANAYSGVISQADMFSSNSVTYYSTNGNKFVLGGGSTAYGSSWGTIGDVIGIAVNTVDNQITFYKNNTSQGVITGLTSGIEWVFATGNQTNTGGGAWNFGQRPFAYTPPTGFVALNTFNLPTPTILQGNKYMDATLWTGTSANQNIVNVGQFKPDFAWIKIRNTTGFHVLVDSLRVGTGGLSILASNATDAEATTSLSSYVTGFNSNGVALGNQAATSYFTNTSGNTFVGWQWQAGQGSTSSNTSGSITSTVSANTTAGFSIVTYTGTGANATVGHGLGVAPRMVIAKPRSAADNWRVYHAGANGGVTPQNFQLVLNSTQAQTSASTIWNNTAPTSSVFSIGTDSGINGNGTTFVAYCWAEISGFSKFGSYTGNGSTDGPFVYTGFRPKFIMYKRTDTTGNWVVLDTARDTINSNDVYLYPNDSSAEATGAFDTDFLSNGFKLRNTNTTYNASGGTYIYMAFAENPFKNSLAR